MRNSWRNEEDLRIQTGKCDQSQEKLAQVIIEKIAKKEIGFIFNYF
jgi:hypothetical protein